MTQRRFSSIVAFAFAVALCSLCSANQVQGAEDEIVHDKSVNIISELLANVTEDYMDQRDGYGGYGRIIQFHGCEAVQQQRSIGDRYGCWNWEDCLETKQFVTFKLCHSCSSCDRNYRFYKVELSHYLATTAPYYQGEQVRSCNVCAKHCHPNRANDSPQSWEYNYSSDKEGSSDKEEIPQAEKRKDAVRRGAKDVHNRVSCDSCLAECDISQRVKRSGNGDASDLLNCRSVYEDDDGYEFYVGPMCTGHGEQIRMSTFENAQCTRSSTVDVEYFSTNRRGDDIDLTNNILERLYDKRSCIYVN